MVRTNLKLGLVLCVAAGAAHSTENAFAGGGPECIARRAAILRERGPQGLDEALASDKQLSARRKALQETIAKLEREIESGAVALAGVKPSNPQVALDKARQQMAFYDYQQELWRDAVDQIGGQRGCTVSRLYWYTDLDKAQAAARQTGRPILSLRMLGKLTDEYSCANSRFFRTALYSNGIISDYLRDNFVLHWQSVRPVPQVTIDFGDGRKLRRTLTGNSAHYVLAASGEPLDVLPGLYGPRQFYEWLVRLRDFHAQYAATLRNERADKLTQFHRDRRAKVYRQWADDVRQLGDSEVELVTVRIDRAIESAQQEGGKSPLAVAASRLAVAKTAAETPLLRFAHFSGPFIETSTDDAMWRRIAALHRSDVQLDKASMKVMRAEFPRAAVAGRLAFTKSVQEDPVLRLVRTFEDSMALDTVRNEYLLHRRIHGQFADGAAEIADVDSLNEWVYAELFLTPSSDPWLGLAPPDVYTALEDDGRVEPADRVAESSGG